MQHNWRSKFLNTPFASLQALIQYPDPVAANNAKTALEGHAIYDGGYNRVCAPSALLNFHEQLVLGWICILSFREMTMRVGLHKMFNMPDMRQSGT